MPRRKRILISNFRCKECDRVMPLPRSYQQREKGHIKTFYCPWCQKETDHIEIRDFDHEIPL